MMTENPAAVLDLGTPTAKQELFYASRALYTAFGGARGGGKTHAVRTKALGGAMRWPGIKILIIRHTYPELQANHIEPITALVPKSIGTYSSTLRALRMRNGSVIRFGHYAGVTSETEYQGQEYDWIFLDEATQFTERDFRYLGGLLRGVNDIPKRFYLTCNPGGVGHRWVKRLFIDRDFRTDGEGAERPEDYAFIPATVEDNTHLMKSSTAYVQMLARLPENIRRAHRYGDWDSLSGSFFPEFSAERHVIRPFRIPAHWTRYRAFDYGLDMLACGWFAVDERGRCYMYREVKVPGLIVSEAARRILENTGYGECITATFAPPDMWSRQKDSGKTMAELFALCGVPLVRADNSRIQGWLQVKELLACGDGREPGLRLFDCCRETASDLQAIQADSVNPSDCAKSPHEVTHTCDMVRYFCISRTIRPEPHPGATHEWGGRNVTEYDRFMTGTSASDSYLLFGA